MKSSSSYNRRIKVLTNLIKSLYPTLERVPSPARRNPGTSKDESKKQAEFNKANDKRLDKNTVKYFLESATFDESRRG